MPGTIPRSGCDHRSVVPAWYKRGNALRKWIRQAEVDEGKVPGVSRGESAEIRECSRRQGPANVISYTRSIIFMRPYVGEARRAVFACDPGAVGSEADGVIPAGQHQQVKQLLLAE